VDAQLLITPLISSDFSYNYYTDSNIEPGFISTFYDSFENTKKKEKKKTPPPPPPTTPPKKLLYTNKAKTEVSAWYVEDSILIM
jgi:hypothetical protein